MIRSICYAGRIAGDYSTADVLLTGALPGKVMVYVKFSVGNEMFGALVRASDTRRKACCRCGARAAETESSRIGESSAKLTWLESESRAGARNICSP